MGAALLSLATGDLGRGALRTIAALALAFLVAALFALAAAVSLLGALAGSVPAASASSPTAVVGTPGSAGEGALAVAWRFLGTPYVWGGASPATGFDCSGLVQWSYGQVGVRLPRTAQQQYDATVRVAPAELRPGDLVFFAHTYESPDPITHVGIYAGDGRMINAPVEGKPISVQSVFSGFWGTHYAGAGRVGS
jgi:cell wall-associated NlpC family hydrolase